MSDVAKRICRECVEIERRAFEDDLTRRPPDMLHQDRDVRLSRLKLLQQTLAELRQ